MNKSELKEEIEKAKNGKKAYLLIMWILVIISLFMPLFWIGVIVVFFEAGKEKKKLNRLKKQLKNK